MMRHGFTLIELLAVIAVIVILAVILLPKLAHVRSGIRPSCQNNLKQIGVSLKMYANESEGHRFPPNKYRGGEDCSESMLDAIWQGDCLYPEYLSDLAVLVCTSDSDGAEEYAAGRWNDRNPDGSRNPENPFNPCLVDNLSYAYFGWTFDACYYIGPGMDANNPNIPADLAGIVGYLDAGIVQTLNDMAAPFMGSTPPTTEQALAIAENDLVIEHSTLGTMKAYRLREGVERYLMGNINDAAETVQAQSELPIVFEFITPDAGSFNHVPAGGNVLYLDGHVEFIRYPGKHPINRAFTAIIAIMNNV